MPANVTVKIQDTINWTAAFLIQRPTTGVAGITNQPALTSANYIMDTILSPPFKWEWNRNSMIGAITTVAGQSDYQISLPTFGFLEKATLVTSNPPANTPPNFELETYEILSKDGIQNRPSKIATLLDDNNGNITFRLFPVPDAAYTVDLLFQNAAPQITVLGSTTWSPIPDKLEFLYERGFLSQMQMMYNQQLALSNQEVFFRQLVATAEGLTEMEKAIFLEDALRPIRMRQSELAGAQSGKAARQ